jgi:hypothetical protein
MRNFTISNTSDLLEFIKLDITTLNQAKNVVCKSFDVIIVTDFTKDQLIEETEKYIEKFLQDNNKERPIFLGLDLSIN